VEPAYLQILDTDDYCSPSDRCNTHAHMAAPEMGLPQPNFQAASTQVSGVILTWAKISLDRIKQITVNIKDANVYSVGDAGKGGGSSRDQVPSRVREVSKSKPQQANFIGSRSSSRMSVRVRLTSDSYSIRIDISALSLQTAP